MGTMEDLINDVADRAEQNTPEEYCFDSEGFRICPKCKTRMQFEISLFGEVRRVPIICKCKEEELKAEEERKRQRQAQDDIERLRKSGLMNRDYISYRLENDDRKNAKISNAVGRYIAKWDELKVKNTGLMFYGPTGTGKTFFAGAIANALIDRGTPVLMSNLPGLVSAMSKGFDEKREEMIHRLSNWPLVILDDVGAERLIDWMAEKINEIIDTRYLSGLPLIITTNLSPNDFSHPADLRYKRIFDRILERCYPIFVDGNSRRQEAARNNREELKEVLGI